MDTLAVPRFTHAPLQLGSVGSGLAKKHALVAGPDTVDGERAIHGARGVPAGAPEDGAIGCVRLADAVPEDNVEGDLPRGKVHPPTEPKRGGERVGGVSSRR